MEEGIIVFKSLTEEIKGSIAIGKPRRWWKEHMIMDVREMGLHVRYLVDLTKDHFDQWIALANAQLKLRFS